MDFCEGSVFPVPRWTFLPRASSFTSCCVAELRPTERRVPGFYVGAPKITYTQGFYILVLRPKAKAREISETTVCRILVFLSSFELVGFL